LSKKKSGKKPKDIIEEEEETLASGVAPTSEQQEETDNVIVDVNSDSDKDQVSTPLHRGEDFIDVSQEEKAAERKMKAKAKADTR
jgi:hypothetical protein